MRKREIKAAMDEIARRLAPFPKFPEAFGPRDRSPYVNSYGRIKSGEDAVAEADRVIAKRKARK